MEKRAGEGVSGEGGVVRGEGGEGGVVRGVSAQPHKLSLR